jgi:tetratricopeptide (TPR) repeat protein
MNAMNSSYDMEATAAPFSSEGFDLDAASGSDDVILEVGGSATKVESTKADESEQQAEVSVSPIAKSEEFKELGNRHFKVGAYLEAYDMYTEAIEACPGMTGAQMLQEKQEFDEKQHEFAMEQHRKFDAERRANKSENDSNEPQRPPPLEPYVPPMHVYGDKLAVYHSNRAAVCLHLGRYEDAIRDCDAAVLLNPRYTKAWMRRSNAYEKTDRIEEALKDAKTALEFEPSNMATRKTVQRLQKLEDERLEKLKEETFGKLKELGNTLLGNFGLSMDNFQAVKGPDGGYSISFNQGKGASV